MSAAARAEGSDFGLFRAGNRAYQGAPWTGQWLSRKIAAQGLGAYCQQLTFCL
jgi:hypothetical protein